MSEPRWPERREVLRRLHVASRLEELRSKYGSDIEGQPLPDWLDSLEGYQAAQGAPERPIQGPAEIEAAKQTSPQPPPQKRVVERSGPSGPRGPGW